MDALRGALERNPYDRESLYAAASFENEAGDADEARRYANRLATLEPEDPNIRAFVNAIGQK